MEFSIGNKKHQIEYNIQEKISNSHLVLNYINNIQEKKIISKNSSKEKTEMPLLMQLFKKEKVPSLLIEFQFKILNQKH